MKSIVKQFDKKAAFTIVELLTVMSIIIILIGMLVPALNQVRRFARKVEQKNQFHTIDVGMDLFHAEWDGYPPSKNENDNYCGAMKLAEAMVGQDLMGFHPDSDFTYITWPNPVYIDKTDLSARRMHLKAESTSAYRVDYLYPNPTDPPYDPCCLVLCDVYTNVTHESTGKLIGMPILYYRANTAGTTHPNPRDPGVGKDDPQNIYDYKDNHTLVGLGMPWDPPTQGGPDHPLLTDPLENFYYKIWNEEVAMPGGRPYKQDSYILLSAGFDGKYGTGDDVFNFEK